MTDKTENPDLKLDATGETGVEHGSLRDRANLRALAEQLGHVAHRGPAPVHLWDPPDRADIGLRIDSNGKWSYLGSPIARAPLVRLFASVLRKDDDGRHYLVTPVEKVPIGVADAPFLAVEMRVEQSGHSQRLVVRTNMDDIVVAGSENPLRFALAEPHDGLKPYITVRGRLEALFTRALTLDLVAVAEIAAVENVPHLGIWSRGCFFAMAPVDE